MPFLLKKKLIVAPISWVALALCYITTSVKRHNDTRTVVFYEHLLCLLSSTIISLFLYKMCHKMVDAMAKNKPGTGCWGILLLLFYLRLDDLTRDRVIGNIQLSV